MNLHVNLMERKIFPFLQIGDILLVSRINYLSPTVFREKGYRFFFFSREESRMHVHVHSEKGEAKFWLEPEIELSRKHNFSPAEISEIQAILKEHYDELASAWKIYFSGSD